jgi:hypothetical protein
MFEKRISIPDTFTEYGTFASEQGVRIDLEGFVDEIKKGKNKRELINEGYENLLSRYGNLYMMIREDTIEMFRSKKRELILLYGYSGKGKSLLIKRFLQDVPRYNIWKMRPKGRRFNGYDGEPIYIIEDFEGCVERLDFKDIFDPWENALVDVKNGAVWFEADTVYITSNKHPMYWWKDISKVDQVAIGRRISKVYYFSKDAEVGVSTKVLETEEEITEFLEYPVLYPSDVVPKEEIHYNS